MMDAIPLVCLTAALALYVLVDGFALGIGVLVLLGPRGQDRDAMVETAASAWPIQATWLCLMGLVLALAFPLVLTLLPAFYLPLAIMAFALVMRGVAFRFRLRPSRLQRVWEYALAGASALAILCQGFILAGLMHGVKPVVGLESIFGLLCAAVLLGGDVLLGAGWLIWRASSAMQTYGREVGHAALLLVIGATVVAIGWALLVEPQSFALPDALTPLLLLLGAAVCVLIWRNLWTNHVYRIFALGLALFALGFAALADAMWMSMGASDVAFAGNVATYAIAFFAGIVLVMTFPLAIGRMFHKDLGRIDGRNELRKIPHTGCRRSMSLPSELHFS
jgi:cytochrome d ubiquinol oxidase subunit II